MTVSWIWQQHEAITKLVFIALQESESLFYIVHIVIAFEVIEVVP